MEENCPNKTKCSNSQEDNPAFSRTCNIYKREGKSFRKNITFQEAKKIKAYMKHNTYANVPQRASPISNNNQPDKYRALIEKLVQLGPND